MGIAGAGNSGTVLTTLLAPRLAERVRLARGVRPRAHPGDARVGGVRAARQGAARAGHAGPPARPAQRPARTRRLAPVRPLRRHVRDVRRARLLPADLLPRPVRDQQGRRRHARRRRRGARLAPAAARRLPRRPGRRHHGPHRRLRGRRRAAAVHVRAPRAGRHGHRVHPGHGHVRDRQRRGLPARRRALPGPDRRAHRARRRRRRPRRVLPADHPRHGQGRVRLLRAGPRRDRRRRDRSR